jgi:hypothetical protein
MIFRTERKFFVVGDYRGRTHPDFARVEAAAGCVAERADAPFLVARPVRSATGHPAAHRV